MEVRLASVAAWNCGLGMLTLLLVGSRTRKPSVFTKKKVLFLRIGPPREAAHSFALSKGRGVPV